MPCGGNAGQDLRAVSLVNLEGLLDWLIELPRGVLLLVLFVLAAIENVFPPLPSDALIAMGAFMAARDGTSPLPVFLSVLAGNTSGALTMYFLGRRFGAAWTEQRLHLKHKEGADARLSSWYARYGLASLFLSRFIPGVRAIVPPFAGALRVPLWAALAALVGASAAWYGAVTLLAFRAGSNWDTLMATVSRMGRETAVLATFLVLIALVIVVRRRSRSRT